MVAPANDNIDYAVRVITTGELYISDRYEQTDATKEPATPAPNGWVPMTGGFEPIPENAFSNEYGLTYRSLWWEFKPAASGTVTVDTILSPGDASNNNDTEMAVYRWRTNGFTRRALETVAGTVVSEGVGYRNKNVVPVVAGETYYIQVNHYQAPPNPVPGIVLSVSGVNSTPQFNLHQTDATPESVTMAWESGTDYLDGYELSVPGKPVISTSALSSVIPGLEPGTEYPVTLQGYTEVRSGHPALSMAAASASASFGGEEGAKAIDGNTATQWTMPAQAGWLRIDLTTPGPVHRYTVRPRTTYPNAAPRTWTFEGSNDGSAWTVLHTKLTDSAPPAEGEVRSYDPTITGNYAYYRLNITSSWGGQSWTSISEVTLRGAHTNAVRTYTLSETVMATTDVPPAPGVPTDLVLVPHITSIDASWTAPTGQPEATGYLIDIGGLGYVDIANVTDWSFLGLLASTLYEVNVKAYTREEISRPTFAVVASSGESGEPDRSIAPENAFDGNPATFWQMGPSTGWLEAVLDGEHTVSAYSIMASANAAEAPRNWQVAVSPDGWNWYYVDSQTNVEFAAGETKTFVLPVEWVGSRVAISITGNNGGGITAIAEFQVKGPAVYTYKESDPATATTTTLSDGVDNTHVGDDVLASMYVGESPVLKVYVGDVLSFEP